MTTCQNFLGICMSDEAWAGWAQAIGSFIGLAVAIGVPWHLHSRAAEREERRKRSEARRLLAITAGLVRRAVIFSELVQATRSDVGGPETQAHRDGQERSALQIESALRAIPVGQLYSAEAVMQLVEAIDILSEARQLIPNRRLNPNDYIGGSGAYGAEWASATAALRNCHRVLSDQLESLSN